MQMPSAAMEWAQESLGRCELGAERRSRRRVTVGAQLASHAGESPVVRGVAIQRRWLLGNAQVTPSAIAEGGFQATGDWWADAAGARRTRG